MLHEETIEIIPFMPEKCPSCMGPVNIVEEIHLMCENELCPGVAIKKLSKALEILDIDGLGPKIAEKLFNTGYFTILEVLDPEVFNADKLLERETFKPGKILDNAVRNVADLTKVDLAKLIQALQIRDIGSTASKQVALYYSDMLYDFFGLNKEAIKNVTDKESNSCKKVLQAIELMKKRNTVIETKNIKSDTADLITVEFTGEPTPFMRVKKEFALAIKPFGYVHTSLTKDTKLLVTDDITSNTGKMQKAKKMGIEIKTYEQLLKELNLLK